MVQVIASLILAAIAGSTAGGVALAAATAFTIGSFAVTYGALTTFLVGTVLSALVIGLGLLLMPHPAPQDGQLNLQQPTPFRRRVYGRAKLGGYFAFWDSTDATLFSVLMIASHECDAFEEHWLGDRRIVFLGPGAAPGPGLNLGPTDPNAVRFVNFPPAANINQYVTGGSHTPHIIINWQLGTSAKASYTRMQAFWPSVWGAQHIGYGVADVCISQQSVGQKDFPTVYPGGQQSYRTVLRGAKIADPREITSPPTSPHTSPSGDLVWSDNAVAVIADYLTHEDGWRIDDSFIYSGMALPITQASCDICDQVVLLKDGGSELRYRLWGYYDFDEEPRQVLARMLAACGGWLEPQPDGTIAIRAGAWIAPTVTLFDEHILGYDVQRYPGEFDAINQVRATFNDPNNDYQQVETMPWEDLADIIRRGYIKSATLDARHCPSFTQARRIQKIGFHEVAPEWTINLLTDKYGLVARNHRFVNLTIAELSLDITCRVTSFVANIKTGQCNIGLASFDASAYAWDPLSEEGIAPPLPEDTSSSKAVETPIGFTATVVVSVVGGVVQGAYVDCSCSQSGTRIDLTCEFYVIPEATGIPSMFAKVTDPTTNNFEAHTALLPNGTYDFQAVFVASNGQFGETVSITGVIVNPSSAAPPAPSGIAASVLETTSPDTVQITFTMSNSPNANAGAVWRSAINLFSTATNISGPIFSSANQLVTYLDHSAGVGTWNYWATCQNTASPPAVSSPDGSVTVTVD